MADAVGAGAPEAVTSHSEEATARRPEEPRDCYDRETCAALCSLMAAAGGGSRDCGPCASPTSSNGNEPTFYDARSDAFKSCPKQLQLPMFLSKTYHMIDRCDDDIAGWSELGDSFVVKNVDRFASSVLPLYFKHSNFSSFARQLNFYGFRKLRSEGILTSTVDPQTSSFVRFYHQNFQRDKPELLTDIKRATKTDQQSKDDLDVLKQEVKALKQALAASSADYDRRLAGLALDCTRRLNAQSEEIEKLRALVRQLVPGESMSNGAQAPVSSSTLPPPVTELSAAVVAAAANTLLSSTASEPAPTPRSQANLLHSLSQVAAAHALEHQNGHATAEPLKRPAPPTLEGSTAKQVRPSDTN